MKVGVDNLAGSSGLARCGSCSRLFLTPHRCRSVSRFGSSRSRPAAHDARVAIAPKTRDERESLVGNFSCLDPGGGEGRGDEGERWFLNQKIEGRGRSCANQTIYGAFPPRA